jgi:hypothetical protein
MKTNKLILSLATTLLCGSLVFTSCKKKKAFKEEDGQTSVDNRDVQSENDAAMTDINDIVATSELGGKGAGTYQAAGVTGTVCGVSIESYDSINGSIVLNYSGIVCNNRKREGKIKLTLQGFPNKKWKDAGAVMTIDFMNYKVTRASDGKSVMLNGSQLAVNVSGTTWWDLLFTTAHKSIVSEIKENGGVNVTFSDGKTALYHINRRVTYSWVSGFTYQCTAEGIGSHESLSNLENYGTTRDGDAFTSQVTTPIVWNTTCGWFAPVQGVVDIKVDSKEFNLIVTFAVNSSGQPVSVAANTCAYGWKVEWKHKNKTKNKIFNYL